MLSRCYQCENKGTKRQTYLALNKGHFTRQRFVVSVSHLELLLKANRLPAVSPNHRENASHCSGASSALMKLKFIRAFEVSPSVQMVASETPSTLEDAPGYLAGVW